MWFGTQSRSVCELILKHQLNSNISFEMFANSRHHKATVIADQLNWVSCQIYECVDLKKDVHSVCDLFSREFYGFTFGIHS